MCSSDHINTVDQWFSSDDCFNNLFPSPIRDLAARHWTPLPIAKEAANFLVTHPNVKILDIGSGVGKFCLAGAYHFPLAQFDGVEQRASLVTLAENVRQKTAFKNVHFIQANFTRIDFSQYDHFYFYNSFYENLIGTDTIDDSIAYSTKHFNTYNQKLFKQLNKMPAGTRIATFHSTEMEIPPNYHIVGEGTDTELKFWIKV